MWLFTNPKNYSEMLKKVAWTMFFVIIIGIYLLTCKSDKFGDLIKFLSFGFQYEYKTFGINLYLANLYIPLIFALVENIFQLHDRISDLLRIRFRFDKFVIINQFLIKLNMADQLKKINQKNRDDIMRLIFYEYTDTLETFADGAKVQKMSEYASPTAYGKTEIINRAYSRLGEDKYNLFHNNCESFVRWCRNGSENL